MLLEEATVPTYERVRELAAPVATLPCRPHDLSPFQPELEPYDALIGGAA